MDISCRRDSFLNSTPLCVFLLVIMMSISNSKAITNVLQNDDTLSQNNKLGYETSKASLELTWDCNLVLYDSNGDIVWQSDTSKWLFPSCKLHFTNGQLVINGSSLNGPISWTSPNVNSRGKYIAVVLPDGKLSIYGPMIWAVGEVEEKMGNTNSSNNSNNELMVSSVKINHHSVYNVLFSGDILYDLGRRYDQSELIDNGNRFSIRKADCELILENSKGEITWRTWTKGFGKNCFATLNNKGELAIRDRDNNNKLVWINELPQEMPEGNYVLVMQRQGNVVIYGPEVWSIPNLLSGFIKMRTDEK